MDLQEYERYKFRLAEIIRTARLGAPAHDYDADRHWVDLLARLAEDRFTVVVAGRFNRGKSSLMNAILGMDRLPTGIVPLTSVITSVRYGTSERVLLDYIGRGLRAEAKLKDLADYVTEKGNPGNTKQIRDAEIQLPAEILRRGFFFVDTPGLGSAIFENSETTRQYIPEIDVLILVTSFESPLTEDEIRFLQQAEGSVRAVFVVINKQDTVTADARREVSDYVNKTVHELLGREIKAFSVSARDGLAAKLSANMDALQDTGILDLEEELVRFLTDARAGLFLLGMCDRVLRGLELFPVAESGREHLASQVRMLHDEVAKTRVSEEKMTRAAIRETLPAVRTRLQEIPPCEVCRDVVDKVFKFLAQYQYDLSTRPEIQKEHADRGGFCALHTWHYEHIASPRGVCTSYPTLLTRTAERLRQTASTCNDASSIRVFGFECPACKVRWQTEQERVRLILERIRSANTIESSQVSALCLPHLQLLLQRTESPELRNQLLLTEATLLERTAEDMERYAIKHDALRRYLASREESSAPLRGLELVVGHRNVNATFVVEDIM